MAKGRKPLTSLLIYALLWLNFKAEVKKRLEDEILR
jgi:hypothetical protein